jgi:hypothetical protein
MRVKIIHDQPDLTGLGIPLQQITDLQRPIFFGSSLGDMNKTTSFQRLNKKENLSDPVPDVFIVIPHHLSRRHGDGRPHLANQLFARFIHANHRILLVIGKLVHAQYVLHRSHKGGICFRRYFPAFFQVRLKFVFFKAFWTDDFEMWSKTCNATNCSANNRTVQRLRPSGAFEQAKAISRASFSPSKIDGRGGFSRFFRSSATSRPPSTILRLVCSIVRVVIPRAWAMRSLGHAGPSVPASQRSNILACMNLLAPIWSFFVNASSSSRSELLNIIRYRFAMVASSF